eukprot:9591805-Prorocentrum_lima.AAC.1
MSKGLCCKPKDGSETAYACIVKDMNYAGYIAISHILSADALRPPQRRDSAWIQGVAHACEPVVGRLPDATMGQSVAWDSHVLASPNASHSDVFAPRCTG